MESPQHRTDRRNCGRGHRRFRGVASGHGKPPCSAGTNGLRYQGQAPRVARACRARWVRCRERRLRADRCLLPRDTGWGRDGRHNPEWFRRGRRRLVVIHSPDSGFRARRDGRLPRKPRRHVAWTRPCGRIGRGRGQHEHRRRHDPDRVGCRCGRVCRRGRCGSDWVQRQRRHQRHPLSGGVRRGHLGRFHGSPRRPGTRIELQLDD